MDLNFQPYFRTSSEIYLREVFPYIRAKKKNLNKEKRAAIIPRPIGFDWKQKFPFG